MSGDRQRGRFAHEPARGVDPAAAGRRAIAARRPVLRKQVAVSQPGDALEVEADAAAHAILGGQRVSVSEGSAPGGPIQRVPRPTTAVNNGMITRELPGVALAAHGRVTLHVGIYVEVVGRTGATLQVRVQSGYGGATAEIPADAFRVETEVGDAASSTADAPDQRIMYRSFRAPLWGPGGPRLADLDQGAIGDCYLLAALGAIVTANPARIQGMITPHDPDLDSYQVTLHQFERGLGGYRLVPHAYAIDTNFPVLADRQHRATSQLAYAGEGAAHAGAPGAAAATTPVLWPLLIEKAYGQQAGGYQNIDNDQHLRRGRDDEGQDTNDAFQILLGSAGRTNDDVELERQARRDAEALTLPGGHVDERAIAREANPLNLPDADLLTRLQGYLTRHIAVELATVTTAVSPPAHGDEQLVDPSERTLRQLYLRHEYVLERVDLGAGLVHLFNPHGAGGQLSRGLTAAEIKRYFSSITQSASAVADHP